MVIIFPRIPFKIKLHSGASFDATLSSPLQTVRDLSEIFARDICLYICIMRKRWTIYDRVGQHRAEFIANLRSLGPLVLACSMR